MRSIRAEVLVGQGTGLASSGVLCVSGCISLRVHIVADGATTGSVVTKQGEVNVSADLKSTNTVSNPSGGDSWLTLSPSDWLEITSNLSAGALKKVVVVAQIDD